MDQIHSTQVPNHSLYQSKLNRNSYPGGNFERNQLLGDSISLSPLYIGQKNDLHVSTSLSLHQGFPWLQTA